jgi:hypothetical protein
MEVFGSFFPNSGGKYKGEDNMERMKERQLARGPYQWLRVSPLLTVFTFCVVMSLELGDLFCGNIYYCKDNSSLMISAICGVLISALWHLLLLQYIRSDRSELVRKHGRQALIYAGIRTAVPLAIIFLDLSAGLGGSLACWTIPILIILWLTNSSSGLQQVETDLPGPENISSIEEVAMKNENHADILNEILTGLQSEDDRDVLIAISKLAGIQEVNAAIMHELEALSTEDDNPEIRSEAQAALNKLKGANVSNKVSPLEIDSQNPEDILRGILNALKNDSLKMRLQAIAALETINYSSEAIRSQLEKLAISDTNMEVRNAALAALDLSIQRNVQRTLNKLERNNRGMLLQEILSWEKLGLLARQNAEVIRRRYDFDFTPAPKPQPVPVKAAVPRPITQSAPVKEPPVVTAKPVQKIPEGPRPTLLQTLLSETSIKIALYLGAFFVIASAVILGVLNEGARLPILIISTFIFGGFSIVIRKRLPQPSFTLFIVFSFLLPITASVIENYLNLSITGSAGYWFFVSIFMAVVWAFGTWLYESRLFSITAFLSCLLGLLRIGDIFNSPTEFYTTMAGLGTLTGLAGVFFIRKWKNADFALPLLISTQLIQAIVLAVSISAFMIRLFDGSSSLWHLASIFTWAFAFLFFVISNTLFPFVIFPWVAAAVLLPIPWFLGAAFDLSADGSTLIFFVWTTLLAAFSELTQRLEKTHVYSLPLLLTSTISAILTVIMGFADSTTYGLLAAFGIFAVYSVLQVIRARGWIWAFALLNFIIAYFAFFTLPAIAKLNIFPGYLLLVLSLVFLLPDLLLKSDFKDLPNWRLPPRIFGALFTAGNFIVFAPAQDKPLIHTAVVFLIHALFFVLYALRYKQAYIGFIATTALAISLLYTLNHFNLDLWMPVLSILAVLYFLSGFILSKNSSLSPWRIMLETSGLVLGSIISLTALADMKPFSGWFIILIAMLFVLEMYSRRESLFEIGAQVFFSIAGFMILQDFGIEEASFTLLTLSLMILSLDMVFSRTYKSSRILEWPVKTMGALLTLISSVLFLTERSQTAALGFGIFAAFFILYTLIQQKASYGYIATAYIPLSIFFTLDVFQVDIWLPVITGISILYFVIGLLIRSKEDWSLMLRNSALALGTILSFGALVTFKETGGWYAIIIGLLFAAEMYLRRDGLFEIGMPALFSIGVFLILHDFQVDQISYHLLAYSLVWLLSDLLAHLTFTNPRELKWIVRGIGALLTIINYGYLFFSNDPYIGTIGFAVYTLLFLTISLLYRQPTLTYTFTLTLPLFVTFLFREFGVTKWIHPVIMVAVIYYMAGLVLRMYKRLEDWSLPFLNSGLGLGIIVSMAAPILGGMDAALPVAVAATLWAIEAFTRKNVWLAFPANGLYLLAYFIILLELKVDEPQFFSMGAALLGLIQHYLLVRAESKAGAFIMGMLSQFVLLGTTYVQLISQSELVYFFVLFFQSLAVLVYGLVIRSRSLTLFPIAFVVLGVVTILYSALKGLATLYVIGCTGIVLLMLGIFAVLLRERISKISERFSEWKA